VSSKVFNFIDWNLPRAVELRWEQLVRISDFALGGVLVWLISLCDLP